MNENKYFKGLTKRDYIEKAYEIIQNEGIEAVSIRRIAKELGCSSASLYRHFDNLPELLFYAELRTLKLYIDDLNKAKKTWKNVWDIYVGVWDCCCRQAFRHPEAYNILFFTFNNIKLKTAYKEYYNIFPDDIANSNIFFYEMLQTPDYMSRDFEMCKKCIRANAITYENAIRLNRITCLMFEGYLKKILDEGIDPKDIDVRARMFVEDTDKIVMALASDLKNYKGYQRR